MIVDTKFIVHVHVHCMSVVVKYYVVQHKHTKFQGGHFSKKIELPQVISEPILGRLICLPTDNWNELYM